MAAGHQNTCILQRLLVPIAVHEVGEWGMALDEKADV